VVYKINSFSDPRMGIGGKGQKERAHAKVFIIGTGGLGSPAAMCLAAVEAQERSRWWTRIM
jgi:molybdopterin/thiamine biosynthesis adenylyltransferase